MVPAQVVPHHEVE